MFKRSLRIYVPRFNNYLSAFLHGEAQTSSNTVTSNVTSKEKWDLLSAVCLERHPVISRPLNELETKFRNLLNEIEMENDMKSDHELKMEADKKMEKLLKEGSIESDMDASKQTAQDFEDMCLEELRKFQPAPKITEADKKNDTKSLNRKLDRNLLLLVEQQVGQQYYWIPPQAIRKDGESMRQAAERVVAEMCGPELKVMFYGNAPSGFYKYKYPKRTRQSGSVGAKIFYYQAKYLSGSLPTTTKYQWLDREETEKTLPEPVRKDIFEFLVNEQ